MEHTVQGVVYYRDHPSAMVFATSGAGGRVNWPEFQPNRNRHLYATTGRELSSLDELGEGEGLLGLVLERKLDVSTLEGLLDALSEARLVNAKVVSSLLIEGIVGVSISEKSRKTDNDGAEGKDGHPITTKNVQANVALPVDVGVVQLERGREIRVR
jgi:hypothetical protein